MYKSHRCFLLCLCLGHLIAGVSYKEYIQGDSKDIYSGVPLVSSTALNILHFSSEHLPELKTSTNIDLVDGITKPIYSQSQTFCSPHDSCVSRCGNISNDFKYTCNCDSQCSFYGDCCVDFETVCGANFEDKLVKVKFIKKPKCELLFETFPIFMVSECAENWKNESIRNFCHTELPVKCLIPELLSDDEDCETLYYPRCWERLALMCNESIEPNCPALITRECKKLTESVCQNCKKSFWPALGVDNTLYKNSYCTVCNFQRNYTIPNLKNFVSDIQTENDFAIFPVRRCFRSIVDSCNSNSSLSEMCSKFSGPVMRAVKQKNQSTVYKNVYCAQCYNESLHDLKCVSLRTVSSIFSYSNPGELKPSVWDLLLKKEDHGRKVNDLPAAFSMLLNFGLDGRQRVYISSEGDEAMKNHQRRCGKGFIWDPFSKICRKLHCSTEFVLVDYECVRKEPSVEDNTLQNDTALIPDAKADFVHLTLSAEIELLDFLQFNGQEDVAEISETIRESFSTSFNISLDRIRNVRFNISLGNFKDKKQTLLFLKNIEDVSHPITFTIDLDLYESSYSNITEPEPSVDSIVSMLASALSTDGFEFGMYNTTGRIFEMQQTVDFMKCWCKPSEGGEKKEYWNSDFKLILNDNTSLSAGERIKGIYINKTGKFYPKGQFVADILYQGYQHNKHLINVSGLAIVCDWKNKLNQSCARIVLEENEYNILENGSLVVLNRTLSNVIDDSVYEEGKNGSIMVCFLKPSGSFSEKCHVEMNFTQAYVSYILSWISISAMIIVLVTYSLFSSLRNLPGCNTMNLTMSLLVMQITYIFGQRNTVTGRACKAVAIVLHYEILCCFMWMNVMAYDLFKTFGAKTVLNNIRSKGKYLLRYMLYAYGAPLLLILTTFSLDYFLEDSPLSPHYGNHDVCWITNRRAAIAYFASPLALIMFINLCFYVLTICSIRSVKHTLYLSHQKNKQAGKSDVFLYARMAFVIGLTWALAFAAAYVKEEKLTGQILTYLFIIFNTLQGVFIFCVFVCNRRVLGLYRVSFRKVFAIVSNHTKIGTNSNTLTRLANVMHRTISTDTVISTISNSSTLSNDSGLKIIKEENQKQDNNCIE